MSVTLQQVQTVDTASRTWQPLDIKAVTAGDRDDVLVTGTTLLVVTGVTVGFGPTAAVATGVLRGGFDLPSFSGCAVGGSNLDAALIAALSSPGNRVTLSRGGVGPWDTRNPTTATAAPNPHRCPESWPVRGR